MIRHETANQTTASHRSEESLALVVSAFAGVSCFLATIQVMCLGFGVLEIPMSRWLAIVVLLGSAATAWLFAARLGKPVPASLSSRPVAAPVGAFERCLTVVVFGVVLWAGWVWFQLVALAFYRPPLFWDSLVYHIPAIHDWALKGHIGFVHGVPDIPFVNYPMGVEVMGFLTYHLFGTSRLVNASNLWYWPLAFTALALLAGLLGVRGVWRWLAGALVFAVPTFVGQSATAYIDAGFASTVFASLAAACVFVSPIARPAWWKGILLGVSFGLMLGSKGSGLPFLFVLGGVMLVALLWSYRFRVSRTQALSLLMSGLVALAVGGYWYIRNAVVTGNPLYPFSLQFGHKVIGSGWDSTFIESSPSVLAAYPKWAWTFLSWLPLGAPIQGPYNIGGGGLGYVWILGALPAAVYLWVLVIRERRHDELRVLAILTLSITVVMAIHPATWESRFTLWLHGLGLPCLAAVFYDAASRWRRHRGHLVVLGLGVAILAVAIWESRQTLELEWTTGANTEATGTGFLSTAEFWFPGLEDSPGFREFLAAKKVARGRWRGQPGALPAGSLLGGILAMPLGERETFVVPPSTGDYSDPFRDGTVRSAPEISEIARVQDAGVEWFLWEAGDREETPESLGSIADESFTYQVSEDVYFRLFRLSPGKREQNGR